MNPFFTDAHRNQPRGEASSCALNKHPRFQPLQPQRRSSKSAESSALNGLWASFLTGIEGALFTMLWNGCHYRGSLHFGEATWAAVLISVSCFFAMIGYGLGFAAQGSNQDQCAVLKGVGASVVIGVQGALLTVAWNLTCYGGSIQFDQAAWMAILMGVTCLFAGIGYGVGSHLKWETGREAAPVPSFNSTAGGF